MPINTTGPAQPEENTAQQEKLSEKQIREQKIEALNKAMMRNPRFKQILRNTMLLHTNTHTQYFELHPTTSNEPNATTNTTLRKVR